MVRAGAIVVVGLLVAGCTAHKTTRLPLAVNASAMAEMGESISIVQKRKLASLNCRRAGYKIRSASYYQCMRALIARDLQRTRESAEFNIQQAARRGVCLNRTTYRVARCIEI